MLQWSSAVDRHLAALVVEGTLQKVSPGVYYYPKESVFGKLPPEDTALVRTFLKDGRFLMTSPNAYNSLGVGTTQLYNKTTVYNHKRHGEFKLGNRTFHFQMKHHFPNTLSKEFLLVDLVNNLDQLAEDRVEVLKNVASKVPLMNQNKLSYSVKEYANIKAKKYSPQCLTKSKIMAANYLHHHKEFPTLLNIVANEKNIIPALAEKDYWIMHVLYGISKQGFKFELKSGKTLSKGNKNIDRF